MVRGGRAEAPDQSINRRMGKILGSDVSFRLDQKTANIKVATRSSEMQWSVATEEKKQKNQLAQTKFRFIKTITIIRGDDYPASFASTSALHCSKRRQISRSPFIADKCSGV